MLCTGRCVGWAGFDFISRTGFPSKKYLLRTGQESSVLNRIGFGCIYTDLKYLLLSIRYGLELIKCQDLKLHVSPKCIKKECG